MDLVYLEVKATRQFIKVPLELNRRFGDHGRDSCPIYPSKPRGLRNGYCLNKIDPPRMVTGSYRKILLGHTLGKVCKDIY